MCFVCFLLLIAVISDLIANVHDVLHCLRNSKGKGKAQGTCYSAAYISQTRDQQCFIISEVVADWHEPMVLQRIMWQSIAHANGQLDPRCS